MVHGGRDANIRFRQTEGRSEGEPSLRQPAAREPDKGGPVEAIPEGYEVVESVNGVVSLAKARPALIQPEERGLVQAVVAVHPKSRNCRVNVKDERIVVYERTSARRSAGGERTAEEAVHGERI